MAQRQHKYAISFRKIKSKNTEKNRICENGSKNDRQRYTDVENAIPRQKWHVLWIQMPFVKRVQFLNYHHFVRSEHAMNEWSICYHFIILPEKFLVEGRREGETSSGTLENGMHKSFESLLIQVVFLRYCPFSYLHPYSLLPSLLFSHILHRVRVKIKFLP